MESFARQILLGTLRFGTGNNPSDDARASSLGNGMSVVMQLDDAGDQLASLERCLLFAAKRHFGSGVMNLTTSAIGAPPSGYVKSVLASRGMVYSQRSDMSRIADPGSGARSQHITGLSFTSKIGVPSRLVAGCCSPPATAESHSWSLPTLPSRSKVIAARISADRRCHNLIWAPPVFYFARAIEVES